MRVPIWFPASLLLTALLVGALCYEWTQLRQAEEKRLGVELEKTQSKIDQLARITQEVDAIVRARSDVEYRLKLLEKRRRDDDDVTRLVAHLLEARPPEMRIDAISVSTEKR